MKRVHTLSVLVAAVLVAGAFLAGRHSVETVAKAAATAPGPERKPLYWHDPMVPGTRFDKPGKSPFMDMQLVPVYAGGSDDTGVRISPLVQQNLGLRTATVMRLEVGSDVDAVGSVQFDSRREIAVQSRVAGYVEKLHVRAPMERVRPGQALATILAPEWLGPQSEWLALKRAGVAPEIVGAARERLKALSIPDALVQQSERTGMAQARYTLSAPAGGVVAELGLREGAAVGPGMTLFRIAGLDKVWAVIDVPEAQAARLKPGLKVRAVAQADATQTFEGTLSEVLPQVNAATRAVQARFEVDNRAGRLMPGMLLRLRIAGPVLTRLVVPAEAVIRTGTRALVFLRRDNGDFEARDIQLGSDLGERFEVLGGLREGDRVVASGQFLVDSEARLRSALGAMPAASEGGQP